MALDFPLAGGSSGEPMKWPPPLPPDWRSSHNPSPTPPPASAPKPQGDSRQRLADLTHSAVAPSMLAAILGQLAAVHLARKSWSSEKPMASAHIGQLTQSIGAQQLPRYYMTPQDERALGIEGNAAFIPGWARESLKPMGYESPEDEALLRRLYGATHPKHGIVLVPKRVPSSLLSHEMGHGTGTQPGKWHFLLSQLAMSMAPVAGLVTGAAMPIGTRSAAHVMLRNSLLGAGAGALVSAPRLYEELRATHRAGNALKETGVKPEDQSLARKTLRRAFMTYLLASSLPAGAAALAGTSIRARSGGS